jgi:hypothetical protein
MIGARIKETNYSAVKVDDLDGRRYQPCPHHGRSGLFLEVDRARLGGRLLHNAFVVVPPDVGLGGLKLLARLIHLAQHFVEMAGFGLRAERSRRYRERRYRENKRGGEKRGSDAARRDHESCTPIEFGCWFRARCQRSTQAL